MMFPGTTPANAYSRATAETAAVEMNAVGGSIVELRRVDGAWRVVADSPYARRITLAATPARIAGPAAGHPRLRTKADPAGTLAMGTACNCSGGVTPWGTILSGEENIQFLFSGSAAGTPEERNHRAMGVGGLRVNAFGRFQERFDLRNEPTEPNRFGWVVEIDPYDPHPCR
jgi:secreted PhoX family phosphatase